MDIPILEVNELEGGVIEIVLDYAGIITPAYRVIEQVEDELVKRGYLISHERIYETGVLYFAINEHTGFAKRRLYFRKVQ